MKREKKTEMICLLAEELRSTVSKYDKAESKLGYAPSAGYGNLERFESREAIKRRITVLREELLKLSRTFNVPE